MKKFKYKNDQGGSDSIWKGVFILIVLGMLLLVFSSCSEKDNIDKAPIYLTFQSDSSLVVGRILNYNSYNITSIDSIFIYDRVPHEVKRGQIIEFNRPFIGSAMRFKLWISVGRVKGYSSLNQIYHFENEFCLTIK